MHLALLVCLFVKIGNYAQKINAQTSLFSIAVNPIVLRIIKLQLWSNYSGLTPEHSEEYYDGIMSHLELLDCRT